MAASAGKSSCSVVSERWGWVSRRAGAASGGLGKEKRKKGRGTMRRIGSERVDIVGCVSVSAEAASVLHVTSLAESSLIVLPPSRVLNPLATKMFGYMMIIDQYIRQR
jgi:hypothetical protein